MSSVPGIFLRSACRPSWGRLYAACICAVLLFLSLELVLRCQILGFFPKEYVLRDTRDHYAHAAWSVAQAHTLPGDVIPVYIIGGSSIREATLHEDSITLLLNKANAGHTYRAFVMASPFRAGANDLALLDTLPDRPGIIVLGMGLSRFLFGSGFFLPQLTGKRIFAPNKTFLDHMDAHHPDTLHIDPVRKFLSRNTYLLPAIRYAGERIKLLGTPRLQYQQHSLTKRISDEGRRKTVESWKKYGLKDSIPKDLEVSVDLLALFLRKAREKNQMVMIVERPVDHEYLADVMDVPTNAYKTRIKHLTAGMGGGAVYVDFERDLGLPTEAFADPHHLFDSKAREAFTLRVVAEILKIDTQDAPSDAAKTD